ncbi:MAG: DUF3524 domain-containing protein [Bacteroidetes bacterium]|nr:MAG: DUF3524 domain-containing protein [Bacteroidota bacterium]
MKILILEPFFSGSHQQWAEGYQRHSAHDVEILSLKGRHWKWRMFGGAVSLASDFMASDLNPDLLLATDMLDLTTFLSLTRSRTQGIPVAVYFHENQITYPWKGEKSGADSELNRQYGFINYTTALSADKVFFNSQYHLESFLHGLKTFLKAFPDRQELQNVEVIRKKSTVLHLGMDLSEFDAYKKTRSVDVPVLLWNHRWEYDKNPELFFNTLFRLKSEGVSFKLIVLGESYKNSPPVFEEARNKLKGEILHFGFAESRQVYGELLHTADILPVTSNQDFFGGSAVEAIYCNCYPILPDRLAFPEHIPDRFKNDHIYNSDDLFYQMLKNVIVKRLFLNQPHSYKNFVTKYDWSTLAANYDQALQIPTQ